MMLDIEENEDESENMAPKILMFQMRCLFQRYLWGSVSVIVPIVVTSKMNVLNFFPMNIHGRIKIMIVTVMIQRKEKIYYQT